MANFTLHIFYHNRKGQVTINSQVEVNGYPEPSLSTVSRTAILVVCELSFAVTFLENKTGFQT